MKFLVAFVVLTSGACAFAPVARTFVRPATARFVDPSHFLSSSFQEAFTSFSLADAMDSLTEGTAVVDVQQVADAAQAATDQGWFGFLTSPIEGLLQLIHTAFVAVGVDGNAWGISIIVLTLLIKVVTFPLTKTQLESTNKMQAMQPAIKEIQAKYQSNQEVMNQKIAEFYQTNEINPLAGCLPSLVQIPVFIGLYRAVLELAKADKLDEPFLFLPSLEGPTYGADPASGSDWILQGWYVCTVQQSFILATV
jgi:YidC/Oxa1 family membrane protein insertase